MDKVVAHRRGWVANAPSPVKPTLPSETVSGKAPIFSRQPDGGWTVVFVAPHGVASASECVLDANTAELRVAFPGQEAIALVWPRGTGEAQRDGLCARFSRRRGELTISIPGVPVDNDPGDAEGQLLDADLGSASDSVAPSGVDGRSEQMAESGKLSEAEVKWLSEPVVDGRWDQMSESGKLSGAEVNRRVEEFRSKLQDPGATVENGLMVDQETGQTHEVNMNDTSEALEMAGILMLHSATAIGDVAKVRRLLEARVDANAQDELGASVLEKACIVGRLDVAEVLLAGGAAPKSLFGSPSSPLHRAVAVGGSQGQRLVTLLCAHRADPRAKDRSGRTPVDLAQAMRMPVSPELR